MSAVGEYISKPRRSITSNCSQFFAYFCKVWLSSQNLFKQSITFSLLLTFIIRVNTSSFIVMFRSWESVENFLRYRVNLSYPSWISIANDFFAIFKYTSSGHIIAGELNVSSDCVQTLSVGCSVCLYRSEFRFYKLLHLLVHFVTLFPQRWFYFLGFLTTGFYFKLLYSSLM
jgi:hypothetical protein